MRIKAIAVALFLGLAFVGSLRAQTYDAVLDGLQEDPVVATTGTGVGTAVFNPATNILSVSLTFQDLVGTTSDAHIHCCFGEPTDPPPGTTAGVAVGFSSHGFPIGVTSGNFNANIDLLNAANYTPGYVTESGGTVAQARDRLLAAMVPGATTGGAYFNIHSSFRPGGEIRGNISLVPEPASLMLFATCVFGLCCGRRRT
jgi:hypothetical protein